MSIEAVRIDETYATSILKDFEEYLLSDGKATKTLESYVGDVEAFLDIEATTDES